MISLDVAATEFYKNNKYIISSEKLSLSSTAMSEYLFNFVKNFQFFQLKMACLKMIGKVGVICLKILLEKILIIGDDLFVTNKKRLLKGIKNKCSK